MFEHESVLALALLVALNVKPVDVGGYCIVWRYLVKIFLFIQNVILIVGRKQENKGETPAVVAEQSKTARFQIQLRIVLLRPWFKSRLWTGL